MDMKKKGENGTVRYPASPVLLIDDEVNILNAYKIALKYSGINNVICCSDSREVMPLLAKQPIEAVLLDLLMPHIQGEELLRRIGNDFPHIPVVVITAANNVDVAVECMKRGARDFLVKPVERDRIVTVVKSMLELRQLKRENLLLKNRILDTRLHRPEAFASIITRNQKMAAIFRYIEAVASSEEPLLISGETGVGKELVANAIHRLSNRKGEFVSVNVSGLDDTMFADTLFGHKKGAFTDAHQARKGLVEQAQSGTLFLDEIGDLSPASQVKLLRLLQEKEFYPLGYDRPQHARIRTLFSTNRDLEKRVKDDLFRKDLYFRVHTHHIRIPPLRERLDDLPLLIRHFADEAAAATGKAILEVPGEITALLSRYSFPGNIRELRSMIYDAASVATAGVLPVTPFKHIVGKEARVFQVDSDEGASLNLAQMPILPTIKTLENMLITEALKRSDGNISLAARKLGLTRQTLSKRLKNNL